jgi:glycine dehydrogenase
MPGHTVHHTAFFDTISVTPKNESAPALVARAAASGINLRLLNDSTITISLDETTNDLTPLLKIFNAVFAESNIETPTRTSPFLTHPVFNTHHTETEMLRYIRRLEAKDLSLTTSMIPLGSCTMKLNATSEMLPVTWDSVSAIHPGSSRRSIARLSKNGPPIGKVAR